VIQAHGARIHQLTVPTSMTWSVAEELGHAFLLGGDGTIHRVDLRYGRVVAAGRPTVECRTLVVDQDGRHAVVVTAEGGEVIHLQASELLRAPTPAPLEEIVVPARDEDDDEDDDDFDAPLAVVAIEELAVEPPVNGHAAPIALAPPTPPVADARATAAPPTRPAPRPVEIPALPPLALGPLPAAVPPPTVDGPSPYASGRAHLDALLDIVAARTALVIADGWNSGRLSPHNATKRPHELEVDALIGAVPGFAGDKLDQTRDRLAAAEKEAAARVLASTAAGVRLPFPTLVREMKLSPVAAQVLLVVAAPALRGELARLYGVLMNDPARPMVDRFLIEQLIAGGQGMLRDQIARELSPDAPLVRQGLVQVDPAPTSLFARLSVPDALLDRLRGLAPTRTDDIAQIRKADVPLDELLMPAEIKRKVVLALAEPTPTHAPLRLVLRGRRGAGRHSLIAAVAARIEREIVAIDTARLPHARRELVAALRTALFRASLHALVPVLSGLEQIDPTDVEVRDAVRQVLRTHPGPLVVRTSPEGTLPLDPGFVAVDLPPLPETERAAAWVHLLERVGLHADHDRLAARYRIGPGIIKRVITELTLGGVGKGDATAALDEQVRQHVAARLDHVAKHVTRTAHWEDVALPDELLDSLREFIGRARHRRTVYERWGYDAKMTTSRGLTALFYGPPGTGKTMVAGVIAQELGLDMFRVDLARVVSKWVGETEKNLSEVFDAAEDGQVLILFDEADSLFAKRTDVKTSNDRYANLEVNYLLAAPRHLRGHRDPDLEPRRLDRPGVQAPAVAAVAVPVPRRGDPGAAVDRPRHARDADRRRLRLRRPGQALPAVGRLHPQLRAARRVPRRPRGPADGPAAPDARDPARVPRDGQAVDDQPARVASGAGEDQHEQREVVGRVGDHAGDRAGAAPQHAERQAEHEHRDDAVDRVLQRVAGGEEQVGEHHAEPRLQDAAHRQLLADAGDQRDRGARRQRQGRHVEQPVELIFVDGGQAQAADGVGQEVVEPERRRHQHQPEPGAARRPRASPASAARGARGRSRRRGARRSPPARRRRG
jgi:hypothetical protein